MFCTSAVSATFAAETGSFFSAEQALRHYRSQYLVFIRETKKTTDLVPENLDFIVFLKPKPWLARKFEAAIDLTERTFHSLNYSL
jgi:hypothetical protein